MPRPSLTFLMFSVGAIRGNTQRRCLRKVWRVLEDKGVYILITYGAPDYRLRLFKDSRSWTTKLHVIDKSSLETSKWELTKPIPLDTEGGSSVESAIGKSPDVHNIYVCIKTQLEVMRIFFLLVA
ncbi:uncharacterized protein LOC106389219 isoform X1 [Brassica napus]|uniref:uncharacterized protein LOC106389219 isoform X1 n=1 Tax=Brassica napus TaxID=3708 RepID=UPI00207A2F31|nr:uncharacterized protein LOC106389219 isoform X1 [Brassica napus]